MQNININIIFTLNILRYYTSTIEPWLVVVNDFKNVVLRVAPFCPVSGSSSCQAKKIKRFSVGGGEETSEGFSL